MSNRSLIGSNENSEIECFRLLKLFKLTVERLLAGYSPNVWNTYGSLSRLRAIIDDIFTNGLIYEGPQKYWELLCELFLLKPELQPYDEKAQSSALSGIQLCCQWLEKSLLEHTLSIQLQMLIQDEQRILRYYKETAFLHNRACTNALLICLRAVEHNQPALLADLDPSLVMRTSDQSSLILNASVNIPSVKKQTHVICDNVKEIFESSSSLDYATPPESFAEFESESKNLPSYHHIYGGLDDVNGNSLCKAIDKISSQSIKSNSQQAWRNISQYSNENGLSNILINFTPDTTISSASNNAISPIGNNAISRAGCSREKFISPYSLSPISSTDNFRPQKVGETSSNKIVQKQKSGSYLHIDDAPSTSGLSKSNSTHSLPMNLSLNPMVQTHSHQSHSSSSGSYLNTDDQVSSISFSISDTASKTTLDFRDSEVISLPFEAAVEATELEPIDVSSCLWKAQHSRSKSDGTSPCQNPLFPKETEVPTDMGFSSSLPNVLPKDENEKQRKKSIFEDNQVIAPTECFFPKPQPGQTLTSFLSSNDFNICAELDKENAHFCIAEALISAIEKVKCTRALKFIAEEVESDEEIKTLTQRIRIRRREKWREKEMKNLNFLSDGKTDTTTSQSASPKSSSHSSDFDAGQSIGSEEDEIEDIEISDRNDSNLHSVKESGLSLSMASLYSDADIKKASNLTLTNIDTEDERSYLENNSNSQLSAEGIALSLLKQFSEKQLPKASDLQWLISEQEVPQQLLPLPDSWPVSPDSIDEDYNLEKTRLRGNLEWAPPRRQIIFMIQPEPKRKLAISKQNYRCAGCGMKVEKSYIKKFRYCDYLGKFFCHCCHSNNLSYIPGRILWKWDFKNYYVSKFSFNLLDQMFSDPLFNVSGINSNLYCKVRQLDMCREYRTQLFYLKDFIRTCRKTEVIRKELEKYPPHILDDPHQYSVSNFLQVKSGELSKCLSTLVSKCISHITQCMLCRAKGFICEICDKEKDIIFPFQLSRVIHCPVCGACFHKKCHKSGICPKCIRIKARKLKLLEQETIQNGDER